MNSLALILCQLNFWCARTERAQPWHQVYGVVLLILPGPARELDMNMSNTKAPSYGCCGFHQDNKVKCAAWYLGMGPITTGQEKNGLRYPQGTADGCVTTELSLRNSL